MSNISSILISANSLNDITYSNNKFLFVYDNSVVSSINGIDTLDNFNENSRLAKFKSACYDDVNNIWIADSINGLIKITNGIIESTILPNGPSSNNIFDLNFSNSKLFMSHGGHSNYSVNNLNYQGCQFLKITRGKIIPHNFLETIEILFQVQIMVIMNILHHGMMGFQKYQMIIFQINLDTAILTEVLDTTYYSNNRIQISDLKFDNYGKFVGVKFSSSKTIVC